MIKRETARGIIIEDNCVYLLYRERLMENGEINKYFAIPGGGIGKNETKEEAVIREIAEEFSVKVNILGYLGSIDEMTKSYFFHCERIEGEYKLGGEEFDQNNKNNYYEIRKIPVSELKNINIFDYNIEIINKAIEKKYV